MFFIDNSSQFQNSEALCFKDRDKVLFSFGPFCLWTIKKELFYLNRLTFDEILVKVRSIETYDFYCVFVLCTISRNLVLGNLLEKSLGKHSRQSQDSQLHRNMSAMGSTNH